MTMKSIRKLKIEKEESEISDTQIDMQSCFQAVRAGDAIVLNSLLSAGLNPNKVRWSGWTLLHRAAENGHTHICRMLLEHGARVNERSGWGWITPLHLALAHGFVDTGILLFEYGANVDILNKYKLTASDYARKRGLREVSKKFDDEITRLKMIRTAASLSRSSVRTSTTGTGAASAEGSAGGSMSTSLKSRGTRRGCPSPFGNAMLGLDDDF